MIATSDAGTVMALDQLFGYIELRQVYDVVGTRIVLGGYAIHHDGKGGKKVRPVSWNCWIECHTAAEAARAAKSLPDYERAAHNSGEGR